MVPARERNTTSVVTQQLNDAWYVYTAKNGTGRPLMEFYLGDKPCLDSHSYRFPMDSTYYPLEVDRDSNDCPIDHNVNRQFDERYT